MTRPKGRDYRWLRFTAIGLMEMEIFCFDVFSSAVCEKSFTGMVLRSPAPTAATPAFLKKFLRAEFVLGVFIFFCVKPHLIILRLAGQVLRARSG